MTDPKLITDIDQIIYRTKYLFPFQPGVNKSRLQIFDNSIYSMSLPFDSEIICKQIKEFIPNQDLSITDTTANVGGNTLAFSNNFRKVNAIELNTSVFNSLKHNCSTVYKRKNITFYNEDCIDKVKALEGDQDIIFIDPPWGGPAYKEHDKISLYLSDRDIYDIVKEWYVTVNNFKMIIIKCPFNFDIDPFINDMQFSKTYIQKLKKYNMLYIFHNYQ